MDIGVITWIVGGAAALGGAALAYFLKEFADSVIALADRVNTHEGRLGRLEGEIAVLTRHHL